MEQTNTNVTIKLKNDVEVKATLTYRRLYQLQQREPKLYEQYVKAQSQDTPSELDILLIIYVGYKCAENEAEYSFEEFMDLFPDNRVVLQSTFVQLVYPKN